MMTISTRAPPQKKQGKRRAKAMEKLKKRHENRPNQARKTTVESTFTAYRQGIPPARGH